MLKKISLAKPYKDWMNYDIAIKQLLDYSKLNIFDNIKEVKKINILT